MANYEEYIQKLKESNPTIDFDQIFLNIHKKAVVRPRLRLAAAGILTIVLIAFAAYWSQGNWNNEDMLVSYVFEQGNNDGPIMDYVSDQGTFLQ